MLAKIPGGIGAEVSVVPCNVRLRRTHSPNQRRCHVAQFDSLEGQWATDQGFSLGTDVEIINPRSPITDNKWLRKLHGLFLICDR